MLLGSACVYCHTIDGTTASGTIVRYGGRCRRTIGLTSETRPRRTAGFLVSDEPAGGEPPARNAVLL